MSQLESRFSWDLGVSSRTMKSVITTHGLGIVRRALETKITYDDTTILVPSMDQ